MIYDGGGGWVCSRVWRGVFLQSTLILPQQWYWKLPPYWAVISNIIGNHYLIRLYDIGNDHPSWRSFPISSETITQSDMILEMTTQSDIISTYDIGNDLQIGRECWWICGWCRYCEKIFLRFGSNDLTAAANSRWCLRYAGTNFAIFHRDQQMQCNFLSVCLWSCFWLSVLVCRSEMWSEMT